MSDVLGTLSYDNLIAGDQKKLVSRSFTMGKGELVNRGALIARVTATGNWTEANFADRANYDFFGIATETVDTLTTGQTQVSSALVEGEFSNTGVTFFYGDTAATWDELLAEHGIYLRKTEQITGIIG